MTTKSNRRKTLHVSAAGIALSLLLAACSAATTVTEVGSANASTSVIGPLTGGEKGWIYRAPVVDLEARGYIMEEFLVSGTADSYKFAAGTEASFDGIWKTETYEQAAFTTRIYVLRPANAEDYNGTLLAHWQNVSAGYENGWPTGEEFFSGYAWIAVSAQYQGIYGRPGTEDFALVNWDKERYGSLVHPGDAFSYDIFADSVAAALENSAAGDAGPLGDLQTDTVIAVGGSQSALRLATYINAARQHNQVFDGFMLLAHFGIASPLKELSLPELFDMANGGLNAHWSQINDDGDVRIMVIDTQAEALTNFPARQPDSDTFRAWEIAGAPHTPPSTIVMKTLAQQRDGIPPDAEPDRNIVEWDYVKEAGIRYLNDWIKTGSPPPEFDPIEVEMTARGPRYVKDEFGNVLGGIRLPEVALPVGSHTAGRTALLGESDLFTEDQLAERFGNREAYLEAWSNAVDALETAGLLHSHQTADIKARGSEFWP